MGHFPGSFAKIRRIGGITFLKTCKWPQKSLVLVYTHHDHFSTGNNVRLPYTASVELTAGHIDLRGKITINCPVTWIQVWDTWENPENLDIIGGWALCQEGTVIEEDGVQGIKKAGETQLVFEVLFDTMEDLNDLTLVPVYQDQQPIMDEAIPLQTE